MILRASLEYVELDKVKTDYATPSPPVFKNIWWI